MKSLIFLLICPYFYIGKSTYSSDPYFNGNIDDFRMYNRELTSTEASILYTYVSSTTTNVTIINNLFIYNLNNIIASNTKSLYIYNYLTSKLTSLLTSPQQISSFIMTNPTTIVVTLITNSYYVSYDLGVSWSTYSLISPINSLYLINNTLYGSAQDGNVYRIYVGLPGTLTIYDSDKNTNLSTIQLSNFNSYTVINNLTDTKNYNLGSNFTSNNLLIYSSISSNITSFSKQILPTVINILSTVINTSNSNITISGQFTFDKNTYWEKVTINQPNTISPNKLLIPNSSIAYLASLNNDNKINYSLDNCQTWSTLSLVNNITDFYAWSTQDIIVASNNSIYKTTNFGVSWTITNLNYNIVNLAFSDEIGILTDISGNVYKSFNYGYSWSLFNKISSSVTSIFMQSKLLIAIANTKLFLSSDGFNTYKSINAPISIIYLYILNSNYILCASTSQLYVYTNTIFSLLLAIDSITGVTMTSASTIVVSTLTNNYYVSYDNGTTWTSYSLQSPINYLTLFNYSIYGLSSDNNVYKIDLYRAANLTLANLYSNVTTNLNLLNPTINNLGTGYYNFNLIYTPYDISSVTVTNLYFYNITISNYISTNINTYLNIASNYITSSTNYVTSNTFVTGFTRLVYDNNDYSTINMYDGNNGVVCAFVPGIYKTTNGGSNWTYIPYNGNIITSAFLTLSSEIFATTNNGSIIYSNNNGQTWFLLYTLQNIYLSNIYFKTRQFGVISGLTGTLLITINGGINFSNSYPGLNTYYNNVYISLSGTIYAVGTNRAIVSSTNYGTTWNILNNNIFNLPSSIQTFNSIYMNDNYNGFVVGEKGCVLKTIDGGNSWTSNIISSSDLKGVTMIDTNTIIVVGFNGIMFHSIDSGLTWSSMYGPDSTNINCIYKYNGNNLMIGSYGNISKLTYNPKSIYSPYGLIYNGPYPNIISGVPLSISTSLQLWLDAADYSTFILNAILHSDFL